MSNETENELDGGANKAEFERARGRRNTAVGLALAGLAILFFLVTIVKLSGNG